MGISTKSNMDLYSVNWKLTNSIKFDEYMKEVGVGYLLRKAGAACNSTTEISKEADGIRINTQSTVRSTNFVFPVDKEVDYKTMDGRNVKATLSIKGDNVLVTEKWDGKASTLEYGVKDGKMIITCKMNDVICERIHEK